MNKRIVKQVNPYECPFCDPPNTFKSLESRNKHVVTVHQDKVLITYNRNGDDWVSWSPLREE